MISFGARSWRVINLFCRYENGLFSHHRLFFIFKETKHWTEQKDSCTADKTGPHAWLSWVTNEIAWLCLCLFAFVHNPLLILCVRNFLSCHSSSAVCRILWEENLNWCKHPHSLFYWIICWYCATWCGETPDMGTLTILNAGIVFIRGSRLDKMVMEVMRWGLHCFVSVWWAHFVFLFFWEAACSVGGAKVTTRQLSRPVGSSSGCGCGRLVRWMDCTSRTLLSTRRTTQFSLLSGFIWKLSRFKVTVQKTPAEIVCAAEAVGFWGFSALYTFAMNALKTNFNFSFQSKEDSIDYFVSHFDL